jgi:hypothetical protein
MHTILASNVRDGHAGEGRFFNRPEFLAQGPAASALHAGDDFHTVRLRSTSRRTRHTPIS